MRCLSFARQSGFHPAALLHMFRLLSFHGCKFHIIISKLQEKSAKKRQQRRKKPFFPRIGSKIPAPRQQTVPFLPPSLLPTGGERSADGTRTPPFAHTPEACTERARKRRRTHGQNGMPPARLRTDKKTAAPLSPTPRNAYLCMRSKMAAKAATTPKAAGNNHAINNRRRKNI